MLLCGVALEQPSSYLGREISLKNVIIKNLLALFKILLNPTNYVGNLTDYRVGKRKSKKVSAIVGGKVVRIMNRCKNRLS